MVVGGTRKLYCLPLVFVRCVWNTETHLCNYCLYCRLVNDLLLLRPPPPLLVLLLFLLSLRSIHTCLLVHCIITILVGRLVARYNQQ
jgi:hypothetical protein